MHAKALPREAGLGYNRRPMRANLDSESQAFHRLRTWLTRRRFFQLELRLRIELALLGVLLGGFVFWQVRAPLDGIRLAANQNVRLRDGATLRFGDVTAKFFYPSSFHADLRRRISGRFTPTSLTKP